jgi:hypothetical protein
LCWLGVVVVVVVLVRLLGKHPAVPDPVTRQLFPVFLFH